jgi:catechol 2,3-dioxygenase-like lactoylglutathione lyase family enzyme
MTDTRDARRGFLPTTGHDRMTRRSFLGSLAAVAAAPTAAAALAPRPGLAGRQAAEAAGSPPIPVRSWNHMTLTVTDIERSRDFYQGLFRMTIAARQARTLILRVGEGPQFIALGGGRPDVTPHINHFCLTVDAFDDERLVGVLGEHGVAPTDEPGQNAARRVRVRMRGAEFGGAPEGTPELYLGDPDGVVVQLQDTTYCGGEGLLGEFCPTPEPSSSAGLIALQDINHFTVFVSDQQRSIDFYQGLFGMPITRSQGALPLLSVGSGRQFLALAPGPGPARIHHASMSMENFQHEEVMATLEEFGIRPRSADAQGPPEPLTSYVTMRMPDRGGAPEGTPELYFTDPDGILLQLQDVRYCGGGGYLGDVCT